MTFSSGAAVLKQPILPTGDASHGTRRIPPRPHRRQYSFRRPSVTRLCAPVTQLPPPTLATLRPLLLQSRYRDGWPWTSNAINMHVTGRRRWLPSMKLENDPRKYQLPCYSLVIGREENEQLVDPRAKHSAGAEADNAGEASWQSVERNWHDNSPETAPLTPFSHSSILLIAWRNEIRPSTPPAFTTVTDTCHHLRKTLTRAFNNRRHSRHRLFLEAGILDPPFLVSRWIYRPLQNLSLPEFAISDDCPPLLGGVQDAAPSPSPA